MNASPPPQQQQPAAILSPTNSTTVNNSLIGSQLMPVASIPVPGSVPIGVGGTTTQLSNKTLQGTIIASTASTKSFIQPSTKSPSSLSPPSVLTPITTTVVPSSNVFSSVGSVPIQQQKQQQQQQHQQQQQQQQHNPLLLKTPPTPTTTIGGNMTSLPLFPAKTTTITTTATTKNSNTKPPSPPTAAGRKRKNISTTTTATTTISPPSKLNGETVVTNPAVPIKMTSASTNHPLSYNSQVSAGSVLANAPTMTQAVGGIGALSVQQQQHQQQYDDTVHQQHQQQQQQQTVPPKPGQLTEKKLRRLEKNRLSARECRRRKREAAETMLHEINILEAENVQLRLQLQIGQEAETSVNEEQQKLTREIDILLQSGEASEADIYSTLEEFKEKYADYGHSRRSSIEFHLRNIARLLMPTQTTSVVMHAISSSNNLASMMDIATNENNSNSNSNSNSIIKSPPQQNQISATEKIVSNPLATRTDSVPPVASQQQKPQPPAATSNPLSTTATPPPPPQPPFDPKKLFLFLAQYLNVTPQQATALKDSRFVAQEMDSCLEEAFHVLSELRDRLTKTGNDLETEFNNVRSILTPTQAAKFLVWVANNAACMHMLNELWDRVYPST